MLAAASAAPAREREGKDEPISADRPDFVESSEVVGKGRVQLETSFLSEREHTLSMPTLLRVGVGEAVELRFETEGRTLRHSREAETGERSTLGGYADTAVGLLWHALSTRPKINGNFGKQNRMRCKTARAPQCEHCPASGREPTQQRAGSGSQKHIYFRVST
ncbi:hypothetical protein [Massilia sp. Se16.2.3]|uniref:hypothetical protein n=1 Tax=Massilia sp. Se16.2.3 TaxID=2709303 RepID=UPI0016010CEE|nr:hypothetical protein [Massilia sp. Se16.2.3]QNA99495.1 transporter [Massilia sp. Se16.2.3]